MKWHSASESRRASCSAMRSGPSRTSSSMSRRRMIVDYRRAALIPAWRAVALSVFFCSTSSCVLLTALVAQRRGRPRVQRRIDLIDEAVPRRVCDADARVDDERPSRRRRRVTSRSTGSPACCHRAVRSSGLPCPKPRACRSREPARSPTPRARTNRAPTPSPCRRRHRPRARSFHRPDAWS